MLDNYDLHPAINKGKCFQATPPGGDIPREEPPSDSHWLDELYRSCCEALGTPPKEPNPFQRHLEGSLGAPVKEALYILFRRFSRALDEKLGPLAANEKTTLAGMLMEDVDQCTDGVLNRALRAVSRITQPQNPDEYLYRARQGLVDRAVLGLHGGNEIHNWNRASMIAAQEGLGVQANNRNDPNVRTISDEDLRVALQKTFEHHFTPYELPLLLRGALLNEVTALGYGGKQEGGYEIGPMERITDAVGKLLPDLGLKPHDPWSLGKIFAWHSPVEEEAEEIEKLVYASFYELKLDFILGNIYQSLIKNGYLDENKLQPRHLLDFAAHWELCQQAKLRDSDLPYNDPDEQTYIQKFFQEKQYGQLDTILETYPNYWKHLLGQLDLSPYIGELTQFLHTALLENISIATSGDILWLTKTRHVLIALIAMLGTANRYNEETIKELSQVFIDPSTPREGVTHLSLALTFYPSLLPKILEAMDQNKHRWSVEVWRAMLFGVWLAEDPPTRTDILRQAVALGNPQTSKELLQFLERHSVDDPKISEGVKELFLRSHRGRNIVAYAIETKPAHPESLQQLLDFIARNSRTIFNDSDLNKLLEIDYAALHSNPMKFKIVLRCLLSNEIHLSDGTPLSCWFPKAKQPPPSNDSNSEEELTTQWVFLLRGIKKDTKLTNMLLLRISEYKTKLPESIEQLLMFFIVQRLSLFELSDSKQKELFERILSNIGDTSLLLQQLLTDDSVRTQWTKKKKANLPELLRVLLPNHLKTLQKESELPHPGPAHQMLKPLTSLFQTAPADKSKQLNQEIEFTQAWIKALTEPDNGSGSIESALIELTSSGKDFLSQNEAWHALFNACYEQILAVPPSNPSAPTATR